MSNSIQNPSTPGEMDRYWDDDEVDHFITSEAHTATKTPEQFKETHVDINRIYADTLTPIGVSGDFVTQEDILESITASKLDDPNRIFIVRGEPGSGKSQLCEWTKYQINGYGDDDDGIEDYVALHVSRSQTRMDQIINVLTEPLDVDPNVQNIDDLDPQDAASAIVEYMRGIWSTEHFTDPEVRELTEKRGGQSDLRAIFAKNIQEYQDALESRDEHPDFNLLTRSDFRDLRLQVSFSSKLNDNQDLLYSVLKNEAHEYLSRTSLVTSKNNSKNTPSAIKNRVSGRYSSVRTSRRSVSSKNNSSITFSNLAVATTISSSGGLSVGSRTTSMTRWLARMRPRT